MVKVSFVRWSVYCFDCYWSLRRLFFQFRSLTTEPSHFLALNQSSFTKQVTNLSFPFAVPHTENQAFELKCRAQWNPSWTGLSLTALLFSLIAVLQLFPAKQWSHFLLPWFRTDLEDRKGACVHSVLYPAHSSPVAQLAQKICDLWVILAVLCHVRLTGLVIFFFLNPTSSFHSLQHLECSHHSISGREAINNSPCLLQVPLVCSCKEMAWWLYPPGCPSIFLSLSSQPNANRTL